MENLAKPITKEECDAVASLYERVLKAARDNKIKVDYDFWAPIRFFFDRGVPKFPYTTPLRIHHRSDDVPTPQNIKPLDNPKT